MFIINLFTSKTESWATKVWGLSLICQLAIILVSFCPLVEFSQFGSLNLYELKDIATYFLALSLLEIYMVLKQREWFFLPMRLINVLFLWYLLAGQERLVEAHARNSASFYGITSFIEGLTSNLTGGLLAIPATDLGYADIQVSFHILKCLLILLFVYLYLRFAKKQELSHQGWLLSGSARVLLQKAFHLDRLLTITCLLMVVTPFQTLVRFRGGIGNLNRIGFGVNPLIASLLVVCSILILRSLVHHQSQWVNRLILCEILTLIIWNPLVIRNQGSISYGYFLYLIGISLLVVVLLKRRGIVGGIKR